MAKTSELEANLNDIFGKRAPKMPEGGKKFFVKYLPIISLVVGILTILTAINLWRWAHTVDYVGQLCNAYGVTSCAGASRLSLWLWLAMLASLAEGLLYLFAYTGLRDHKRQGWNYLYYGALINVVYAVISLFTDYDAGAGFVGGLIGSAIGFWILFQIREAYLGKTKA